MNYRNKLFLFSCVIGLLSLTPLVLINTELWDAVIVELSLSLNDYLIMKDWLLNNGWYLSYYTYILFHKLSLATGIPPKVFSNILSVISIVGIARETYVLLSTRYNIERTYAYIGTWIILAFPVWHIFISSGVFVNILCLWLFIMAVRLWYSNKLLAIVLLIPSLQLFSLFSFAVGFGVSEFMLTATRDTYKKKVGQLFVFSLVFTLLFVAMKFFINIHGSSGTYNTFTLEKLHYFYGLFAFLLVLAGGGYFLKSQIDDPKEAEQFQRNMLAIIALFFFAFLPYYAVGRPLRFFSFGSFGSRHTILTCIPFAFLTAVITQHIARHISKKAFTYLTGVLIVALIVILHQGYSHKIAASIFKEMLTESFAKTEVPPSGYVAIEVKGAKPPRHVHYYAINMCLYKAYGKTAWLANGYWQRDMDLGPESMKKLYAGLPPEHMKRRYPDLTGRAYTKYEFFLTDYHQEGRFWYWFYHLFSDFSVFNPQLVKKASLP